MKIRFIVSIVFVIPCILFAQRQDTQYSELRAGDDMPDYTFKNLINYPAKTARYSDFKDKLLILDLWSTACSSCIALWPKVLKLQEKFKGRMQVILVNAWEDEATVRKTFARRKQLAGVDVTLPTVCGDLTLADQLFPSLGVPHIVWIYKGKVISRTSGEVNEKNIEAILNGERVSMPQSLSENDNVRIDRKEPLFINGNYGNAASEKIRVVWQSLFTKNSSYLRPTYDIGYDFSKGYFINATNLDIKSMYEIAYGDIRHNEWHSYEASLERLPSSRIIFEVKDPDKYEGLQKGQPALDLTYVYHLFAPPASLQKLLRHMQADLAQYVGLKATWEKRTMKCLVLSAMDTSLVAYKDGEEIERIGFKGDYEFEVNRISIPKLMDRIDDDYVFKSPYPVLDETGMKGLIGGIHEKDVNPANPADIDRALSKHGLRFTLQDRTVDVLVLREPPDFVSLFDSRVPVPGTSKPQNLHLVKREDIIWRFACDPIQEAVQYRLEYKREDEAKWNIMYTKSNRTWIATTEPGEYLVRMAGIAKNNELKTDFSNTSALQYSDEIRISFKQ